jgi:hypothetical protein
MADVVVPVLNVAIVLNDKLQIGILIMLIAGTKISMADGSTKNIEDVVAGDIVYDSQGLSVTVDGLIFRASTMLRTMVTLNNDITATDDTIFCGNTNNTFYAANISLAVGTGALITFVKQNNIIQTLRNFGPDSTTVSQLAENSILDKNITVSSFVESPNTPVGTMIYNLKTSGSGTFVANGFSILGWFRLNWNYSSWSELSSSDKLSIIYNLTTNKQEIIINFDPASLNYKYLKWDWKIARFISPPGAAPTTGGPTIVA